jgi:multimeric flavodoxin WrbA
VQYKQNEISGKIKAMATRSIIIFGSSNSEGKTGKIVTQAIEGHPTPIIDLSNYNISYYDYLNRNRGDDFLPLIEKIITYEQIIFATPVYWYTMSAIMKTFFDRFSDLLTIRKDLGRALAGKEMLVITSYAESIPRGFEDAFSQTAEYLDMHYRGCIYFYTGKNLQLQKQNDELLQKLRKSLTNQKSL